ncbi:hypothetical protein MGG_17550 [Pyricularia oryzae 70-15]|uniref:Uncharacterized protein n=2 Tax=Pyricularia oryzae TaxID=318829 RepID=A4RGK3_PYRO7|nr:uncharacterized protein MGG_17550 [Pyricularia oryzae 70-15]EHA49535.1 hypothetical protein MGG_17550 [Pyricularia oryzae 70-15]ELQ35913.1 hypothetical protein OOU_Y34scaffold00682g1 [Pyricularia oryzae Y34]
MQWLPLALLAVNAFIPSVYAIPGAGTFDTKLNQCDYSNNVQLGTLQPEDASKSYAACCSATSGQKLEAACRFSRL